MGLAHIPKLYSPGLYPTNIIFSPTPNLNFNLTFKSFCVSKCTCSLLLEETAFHPAWLFTRLDTSPEDVYSDNTESQICGFCQPPQATTSHTVCQCRWRTYLGGWKPTGCIWTSRRPRFCGARPHGVNMSFRLVQFVSVQPVCPLFVTSESTLTPTSPWQLASLTPLEHDSCRCVSSAVCGVLCRYTLCRPCRSVLLSSAKSRLLHFCPGRHFRKFAESLAVGAECRRSAYTRVLSTVVAAVVVVVVGPFATLQCYSCAWLFQFQ